MTVRDHLAALEVQLRIALAQVALAQAAVAPPIAEPPLPASCARVPPDKCARQNPDARVDVAGMGGAPPLWVCRGCGERLE